MPEQNIDVNARRSGPFDPQLTQAFVPQSNPHAPMGDSPIVPIMEFATQFLKGARESRLSNAYKQEQQKGKNITALQALMQHSENAGMTPAAKQSLQASIMQRLVGEVAGADHGDKKAESTNPMVGFVKNIARNLMGGEKAAKVKPLGDEDLAGYVHHLTDPNNKVETVQNNAFKLLQDVFHDSTERIGEQPIVNAATVQAHPKFAEAMQMYSQSGGMNDAAKMMFQRLSTPEQIEDLKYNYAWRNSMNGVQPANGQPANGGAAAPAASGAAAAPAVAPVQDQNASGIPPYANAPAGSAMNQFVAGINQHAESQAKAAGINPALGAIDSIPASSAPNAAQGAAIQQVAGAQPTAQPQSQPAPATSGARGISGYYTGAAPAGIANVPKAYASMKPEEMYGFHPQNENEVHALRVFPNGRAYDPSRMQWVDTGAMSGDGWRIQKNAPAYNRNISTPEQAAVARTAMTSFVGSHALDPDQKSMAMGAWDAAIAGTDNVEAAQRAVKDQLGVFERNRIEKQRQEEHRQLVLQGQDLKAQQMGLKYASSFDKNTAYVQYQTIKEQSDNAQVAYDGALQASAGGNKNKMQGYHDLMLVRSLARATDSKTGVRDAEQKLFADAQGQVNAWMAKLEGGWLNGAILTPEARKNIYNLMGTIKDKSLERARQNTRGMAVQAEAGGFGEMIPEPLRQSKTQQASGGSEVDPFGGGSGGTATPPKAGLKWK